MKCFGFGKNEPICSENSVGTPSAQKTPSCPFVDDYMDDTAKGLLGLPNGTGKFVMIGLGLALAAAVTVAVIYLFQSGILSNAMQSIHNIMPTQMPPALTKMLSFVQNPDVISGLIAFGGTAAGVLGLAGVSYLGLSGVKAIRGKIKEHKEQKFPEILLHMTDPRETQVSKHPPPPRTPPNVPMYTGL